MSDSGVPLKVVAAADINTTANSVYRHNFPGTRHLQRNIQSFTADELDKLQLDVLTMSPPCQPFSRWARQDAASVVKWRNAPLPMSVFALNVVAVLHHLLVSVIWPLLIFDLVLSDMCQ